MPEPTPQKTHNSLLKTTREAKGLTLDIVHEATKIPLDALKAIEEGYSVRMLTPFYYRGFLKIYAEFLGLDPAEVLSRYEVQKPKPLSAQPSRFDQPKREIFSPKNRSMMVRWIGIVLAVVVVLIVGGFAINSAFKKNTVSVSGEKSASAVKKIQRAEEPAAPRSQIIKTQSNSAKVTLAVRVPKNTWIRVKADDKVVFQDKMKKGTTESWSAKDRIELSGKNINELDLEVNGRHIGPLGGAERGAKRVVITKEGLTVKK